MECIVLVHGKISSANGVPRRTYQIELCNSWFPKRRNVHDKGKTLSSVSEDSRLQIKKFRTTRVETLKRWLHTPILVSLQYNSS